ncbi:MAG: hypothetical protein ABSA14_13060 [Acidimicrobiales bacterium]
MANSFTMRRRKREVLLRICGVIDLCAGVILFLLGLALMAVGTWQGIVAFLCSPLVLWAGTLMTWSRVYANPQGIVTTSNRPHRAKRNDIAAIDIRRSDFGQIKQVVPFVRLKNGKSFKLLPLCLSSGQSVAPQFRDQRREMLDRQLKLVEELRSVLGVGGSNYSED